MSCSRKWKLSCNSSLEANEKQWSAIFEMAERPIWVVTSARYSVLHILPMVTSQLVRQKMEACAFGTWRVANLFVRFKKSNVGPSHWPLALMANWLQRLTHQARLQLLYLKRSRMRSNRKSKVKFPKAPLSFG